MPAAAATLVAEVSMTDGLIPREIACGLVTAFSA